MTTFKQNRAARRAEAATARRDSAAATVSPDELLAPNQLADELDLSARTLEGWRGTGTGPPYIRFGGRIVRYRRGDVIEWLAQRRFTSTSNEIAA